MVSAARLITMEPLRENGLLPSAPVQPSAEGDEEIGRGRERLEDLLSRGEHEICRQAWPGRHT